MSTARYAVCISALAISASFVVAIQFRNSRISGTRSPHLPLTSQEFRSRRYTEPLSLPRTFEANMGQADPHIQFLARSQGLSLLLTTTGIEIHPVHSPLPNSRPEFLSLAFSVAGQNSAVPSTKSCRGVTWKGIEKLHAESNYLNGPRSEALAPAHSTLRAGRTNAILRGVDAVVYGSAEELEYDLRIAPDMSADDLRLNISGAKSLRLNPEGDVLLQVGGSQIRMRKPAVYEEAGSRNRANKKSKADRLPEKLPIDGTYLLEADGSVGFHIGKRDPNTTLVIDPSLSVVYTTFLGGTGEDSANSIALDSSGKVYVGGTTTSAQSFSEPRRNRAAPAAALTSSSRKSIHPSPARRGSLPHLSVALAMKAAACLP